MKAPITRSGYTHADLVRRGRDQRALPTWEDVAAAFDAGMHYGVKNRQSARRELYERDAGPGRLVTMLRKDKRVTTEEVRRRCSP